jgi:hypothetical protein
LIKIIFCFASLGKPCPLGLRDAFLGGKANFLLKLRF